MARKHGTTIIAGALIGLGLNGIGAYAMNKAMPHGDASKPLWHQGTVGISATSLAMIFFGVVMAAALFALDPQSEWPAGSLLKFTALSVIVWALIGAFIF